MRKNQRSTFSRLSALLFLTAAFLAYFFYHQHRHLSVLSAPLDDTYIHLRFAWNIAHGGGFAFNPGQPLPGTTSPLWVILLVPFAFWSQEFLVTMSLVLSALSHLAAGLLAFLLARRVGLKESSAFLVAALVFFNGRLLWAGMSGMETELFTALTLAAAFVYLGEWDKGLSWRTGILLGLAGAARPEGYIFAGGIFLHYLLRRGWQAQSFHPLFLVRSFPLRAFLFALVVPGPYLLFSLVTIHHLLPSTYVAKELEYSQFRVSFLKWFPIYLVLDNPLAAIFMVVALFLCVRRLFQYRLEFMTSAPGLVAGWAFGQLFLFALLAPMPFHFCRYQMPLLPFFILLAVSAMREVMGQEALFSSALADKRKEEARDAGGSGTQDAPLPRRPGPKAAAIVAGALLFLQLLSASVWPGVTTRCARDIQQMHVTIGRHLARITGENDRIATMDIGAIGFYSGREIVDLFGLVTPEILPYIRGKGITRERSEAILEYLGRVQPSYVAVFPEVFPGLLDDRRVFVPVYEVRLPARQITMADWMVVCHCLWYRASRPGSGGEHWQTNDGSGYNKEKQ